MSRLPALLLLCLTTVIVRGAERPLTPDDIRQLVAAGVAPDVIITKLTTTRCDCHLTSQAILHLTKDGVPQAVIAAMLTSATRSVAEPDPCASDLLPSPVVFADVAWDQAGAHFDLVTLAVSTAGVCLKRTEDHIGRSIRWTNVAALCDEHGFYRHAYLKLKHREPLLTPFADDTVLIFNGAPTALRPLVRYIRTLQPDLAVDCPAMEE
jgi:hypothetical protein